MKDKNREVLGALRMQLTQYFEKGIGAQSVLSKNTTITPKLVKDTFNRYLELGGDLTFIKDNDLDEYNKFIDEITEKEEAISC